MKKLMTDIIFLALVSGAGFILAWWSVFIICFFWAFLMIASPRRIFTTVLISYCFLIAGLGEKLIQVLKFSNLKYAIIPVVALIFALICFCVSQVALELGKKRPD
jgi:uncharacterized membrane protein YfhO